MRSYAVGDSAPPLVDSTIGDLFDRTVAAHGQRDALIAPHQRIRRTYAELRQEVDRVARALLALGIRPGDRVGVWSGNRAEWVMVQYAVARIGAILVTINPAYQQDDLLFALRQADVTLLVAAARFLDQDQTRALRTLPASVRLVLLPEHASTPAPALPAAALEWTAFLQAGDAVDEAALRARAARCRSEDLCMILYTSGTTGRPKGVTLTHHVVVNGGYSLGERLRCTAQDRLCLPVPLYHCLGSVMGNLTALAAGAAVVLPAEAFDPRRCLDAIDRERCTTLYGVPTMFIAQVAMLAGGSWRTESLRTGIMAGAPCPADLMREVMRLLHMPEVTVCYGMTETPLVTQTRLGDSVEDRVTTVGALLPHVECQVVDPITREVVPRGQPGEICVRGYGTTRGYWNDETATRVLIDDAGWLHTGDLGVMRDDGLIAISGRLKDLIIRGGENIYPREIEEVLAACPKILEAYVVGVPDPHYGEETCAWVRLRSGETATAAEIRRYCRERLASYQIPRHVCFTETFPTTSTGKVRKVHLREQAAAQFARA